MHGSSLTFALFALALASLAHASIICPSDMMLPANSNCVAVAHFSEAISTTGVETDQIAGLYTGDEYPIGETVNTFLDANGDTCDFTVTVVDASPPTLTCPTFISQGTDFGQCFATINAPEPSAVDCSAVEIVQTEGIPMDEPFLLGSRPMSYTATDEYGNESTCSFTVSVAEAVPTVECPNDMVLDAGPSCDAVAEYRFPAVIACHANDFVQTEGQVSGSTYPLGVHQHTFTTTTEIHNFETIVCSFTITVQDADAPTITCADDILVLASFGDCEEITSYPVPHAHDNCGAASVTQVAGLEQSALFPVGTTLNTFQAVDEAGNVAECSVAIVVADTQPPTITCPADIHASSDSCINGEVVYDMPVASDNCIDYELELIAGFAQGEAAPYGRSTVTYQATDSAGLTSFCSFDVTQSDPSPPEIFCPEGYAIETSPGSCYGVLAYDLPPATDDCSANPTVVMFDSVPSGSMVHAGQVVIKFRATDDGGLSTVCDSIYQVEDLEAPVITCPSNVVLNTDPGLCSAVFQHEQPVAFDNCHSTTVTQAAGPQDGEDFPPGVNLVTFVAIDPSNNFASCNYTVTVHDNEPPQVQCPADLFYNTDFGVCTARTSFQATITDNCDVGTIAPHYEYPPGYALDAGEHVNTFTATDSFGQQASCSFLITINDNQMPILSCPHSVTVPLGEPVDYSVTAKDNCPDVGILHMAGPAKGSTPEPGTYTVEWQAMDSAGLVAHCTFPLTVDSGIIAPADDSNIYLFTDFDVILSEDLTESLPGFFVGFHLETLDTQSIVYSSEMVDVSATPSFRSLMMCTPGSYRFVLISGSLLLPGPEIRVCTSDTIDFPQGCVVH